MTMDVCNGLRPIDALKFQIIGANNVYIACAVVI